jgi:hypothetical protein
MSRLPNTARLQWTLFEESQEAILHGNVDRAVEICVSIREVLPNHD